MLEKMKRLWAGDKGFTLVELLLAITVFSIVIVGIYSSLALGIKVHRRSAVMGGDYTDMGLVYDVMTRDLRSIVAISGVYMQCESDNIYFYSAQPNYSGSRDLNKITYSWKGSRNEVSFFRLKESYIDSMQKEYKESEEILSGMLTFNFKYGYYKEVGVDERELVWKNDWKEESIPKMVKIEMSKNDEYFEKVIVCPTGNLLELKEMELE